VIGKIDSSRFFRALQRSSTTETAKIGGLGELAAVLEGRLSPLQRIAAPPDSQRFEIPATLGNWLRVAPQSWQMRQNSQTYDEESAAQRVMILCGCIYYAI